MTESSNQIISPNRSALLSKLKEQKSRLDVLTQQEQPEPVVVTSPKKQTHKSTRQQKHSWTDEERLEFGKIAQQYQQPTSKDWPTFAQELNEALSYENDDQKLTPMQCQNHWYNTHPKTSRNEPQVEQTVKRTRRSTAKTSTSGVKKKSKKVQTKRGKETFLSAAMSVIREAGIPLTATEIAKRILDQDLVATKGKTPELTIAARIYSDLKQKGTSSNFTYVQPYVFGLREFGDEDEGTPRKRRKSTTKTSPKKEPPVKRRRKIVHNTNTDDATTSNNEVAVNGELIEHVEEEQHADEQDENKSLDVPTNTTDESIVDDADTAESNFDVSQFMAQDHPDDAH
jgi:hypothetical protein